MTDISHRPTSIDEAPSALQPPPGALVESSVKRHPATTVTRRRFMTFLIAGVTGSVLSAMGAFPPARRGLAHYAPGDVWGSSCRGYYSPSTTCVPSSAYFGSDVCTSTKWHSDAGASGSGYSINYVMDHDSCDTRNAWVWSPAPGKVRCSDGAKYTSVQGGGTSYTFSICRYYYV